MHCSFCGSRNLRKDRRTRLFRCRAHGLVGPRPAVEALRHGVTLAQWSLIWAAIVAARASTPEDQALIKQPFLERFHAAQ